MQKNNPQTGGKISPVNPPSPLIPIPRPRRIKSSVPNSSQRASRKQRIDSAYGESTVSAMLPRNEQSLLREVIDEDKERSARDYLHCLVRPDECAARIPDSFSGDTALISSTTVLRVPVYFTGMGSDAGRFSLIAQPTIGSLSAPSKYKIAQVATQQSGPNYFWPHDLTDPAHFISLDNGMDIRIDKFYSLMTQPSMAVTVLSGDRATSSSNNPFGNLVTKLSGYGLDVGYTYLPGPASYFTPPPGNYFVSVQLDNSSAGNLFPITVTPYGGATVTLAFSGGSLLALADWSGYVNIPEVAPNNAGTGITVSSGSTGQVNSKISFTRTFTDVDGLSTNQGLVSKLRPVGMSVLATYTGPTLLDGGNIASCFLPAGASDAQYFTTNPNSTSGSLSNWENIAGIKGGTTYPITNGTYSWWSPTSSSDYDMQTVSGSTSHQYPNIVVSGQCVPGNTTPVDGASYVRVIITTVYEVTTDSTFLPSRHQKGSQAEMDRVLNHLVGVPHVMENPTHTSFGQKILNAFKSAGNWVWKNRRPIGTAIGALGSLI